MTDSILYSLRTVLSQLPTTWQELRRGPCLAPVSVDSIHMKKGFTGRNIVQMINPLKAVEADILGYCSSAVDCCQFYCFGLVSCSLLYHNVL